MSQIGKFAVPLTVAGAVLAVGAFGAVTAHAQTNLLLNPSLDKIGPQGTSTSLTLPASAPQSTNGYSAADKWTTWVLPGGTVSTRLEPSELISNGHMLHVVVKGGAGLVQDFSQHLQQQNIAPPQLAYACVWIRLLSGVVTIGLGHGGNTHPEVVLLEATKTWQRLEVSNGVAPATELIVYAYGPGGNAEFYVESAFVAAAKSPIGCQPQ